MADGRRRRVTEWNVSLYDGSFTVDADTEDEARHEALQCLAESLDLFVVRELRDYPPTPEEVRGILPKPPTEGWPDA